MGNNNTTYSYTPDGLSGIVRYDSRTSTYTPYAVETDHLGSITSLYNSSGTKVMGASFDAWGKRTQTTSTLEFRRGFTGHEHIDGFDLINMNGRVYDPLIGRFLSPDMYVQLPGFSQSFNRYSYCLNNPYKYTDPDGESIIGAVIVGAIIGTYSGGVLANDGEKNPFDWNYNSLDTWCYMACGLYVGAMSGAVGGYIASSGIPLANTLSIMGGSLTNSLGTYAYTGGQTDITMSFGFASYNFTQKTWGWLGKEGNSTLENISYSLGLLANISDILTGLHPGDVTGRVENDPNPPKTKDLISHYQINDEGKIIIDWGPEQPVYIDDIFKLVDGTNNFEKGRLVQNVNGARMLNPVTIKNVNIGRLRTFGQYINNNSKYNLFYNNCVNMASRALNISGVFNIGIHPYLLQTEMFLRSAGVRPLLFSYYGIN